MGRLEVINRGYGFQFYYNWGEFMDFHWENVLPKDLSVYNVPDGLEDWQKACCVGYTAKRLEYCRKQDPDIDFDDIEDFEVKDYLIAALGICFEEMYELPKDSISSLEDYNGDDMFFLNVQWPPEEYNETLAQLTQESFLGKINDFLNKLAGNDSGEPRVFYDELQLCEEYDKW